MKNKSNRSPAIFAVLAWIIINLIFMILELTIFNDAADLNNSILLILWILSIIGLLSMRKIGAAITLFTLTYAFSFNAFNVIYFTEARALNSISAIINAIAIIYARAFMWGEEFGWRGYLQTRLFGEKPLLAALTTGLTWGIWHFPAILVGFIPNQNGVLSLLLFPWYTIWFSIILGWLIRRTNTIWTATLAHSANNFILNSTQVGLLLSFSGGLGDLLLSIPAIIIVIPITLLCSWTVTRLRM